MSCQLMNIRLHGSTLTQHKRISHVNLYIRFYQNEKNNNKIKTNFSINQIDINYEKLNK